MGTYSQPAPVTYKDETPKPYSFEYAVNDDYAGATFSQQETSDAQTVTGSYSVALPDGRTQIVTYTADPTGYSGYTADIKYEGTAIPYEPPKVTFKPAPAPVYSSAPVIITKPAPVIITKPAPVIITKPA